MATLLKVQKTEVDELNRLIRNYKADGASRKTERYLKDKLSTFTESFRVISDNEDEIQLIKSERDEREQPYFVENTFQCLEQAYDQVMADIKKRLQQLESPPAVVPKQSTPVVNTTNTSNENDAPPTISEMTEQNGTGLRNGSDQSQLDVNTNTGLPLDGNGTSEEPSGNADNNTMRRPDNNTINLSDSSLFVHDDAEETDLLTIYYNESMDILAASRSLNNESSQGLINFHRNNLSSIWNEFRGIYHQAIVNKKTTKFDYQVLSRKYIDILGKLGDLADRPIKIDRPSNTQACSNVQFSLPKIQLPEFGGKPSEWKSFIGLFDRMVHHNLQIDNGLKIEYLKTCMKGEAAKVINHVSPNPENYFTCYEILRNRFDNKRELLGTLIDNIMHLPKLTTECPQKLKSMHDTSEQTCGIADTWRR